jgi:hypothetical protein
VVDRWGPSLSLGTSSRHPQVHRRDSIRAAARLYWQGALAGDSWLTPSVYWPSQVVMQSRTSERPLTSSFARGTAISQENRASYPHIYGPPSAVEEVALLLATSFRHSMLVKSI